MGSCTSVRLNAFDQSRKTRWHLNSWPGNFIPDHLPEELEHVTPSRRGPAGRFFDLTADVPLPEDFLTPPASDEEGESPMPTSEETPDRNVRRRITLTEEDWRQRASAPSPRGPSTVRERDLTVPPEESVEHPVDKAPRLSYPDDHLSEYEPSPVEFPGFSLEGTIQDDAPLSSAENGPCASSDAPILNDAAMCCEVAFEKTVTLDCGMP